MFPKKVEHNKTPHRHINNIKSWIYTTKCGNLYIKEPALTHTNDFC